MFSLSIYSSLFLCVFALVHRAEKKDLFRYAFIAVVFLSLIAGLRDSSVGRDTNTYFLIFDRLTNNLSPLTYIYIPDVEESFLIVVRFLLLICNNYSFVFVVFAFITNYLVVKRLWDFRENISFAFSVLIYLFAFYFMSMNISRQLLAVSFVFFGSRYIEKKKYWLFFIYVALGFCFHRSALLGSLYIVSEFAQWKTLSKNQKIQMLLIVFAGILSSSLFVISFRKYLEYFSSPSFNFGFVFIIKLIFFVLLSFMFRKKDLLTGSSDNRNQIISIYVYIGLFLSVIGYIFQYMNRISFYFTIFDCVYLGYIKDVKLKSNRVILYIASLVIWGGLFIVDYYTNGNGTVPYKFIW